jgi:hypothetical protein
LIKLLALMIKIRADSETHLPQRRRHAAARAISRWDGRAAMLAEVKRRICDPGCPG